METRFLRGYLSPVGYSLRSGHTRAVGTTVEMSFRLDAVADHLHAAVLANRGEGVYGALEAVEGALVATCHGYWNALAFRTPVTNAASLTVVAVRQMHK